MQAPLPHISAPQVAQQAARKSPFKLPRQTWVLLGVSLLAGLGAAWFARLHIEQQIGQHIQAHQRQHEVRASASPADSATVVRLVAARDLPAGVVLDADQVAVREFPAHLVASDSLGIDQYEAMVKGQAVTAPLRAGDAILGVHVRDPVRVPVRVEAADTAARNALLSASAPFSAALAPGRRAMTLPIDEVNSAAGLLAPGDLIDLYVSFDHQQRRMTVALLQGVRVLATGQQTEQTSGHDSNRTLHASRYATITLDTSPTEALKLIAARQSGSITALLRQRGDKATILPQPSAQGDLAALLGISKVPPAPARPAVPRRIPIIYGDLASVPPTPAAMPVQQKTLDGHTNHGGADHGGADHDGQ